MGFDKFLGGLRKIGRQYVLPVQKIQQTIHEVLENISTEMDAGDYLNIIDLGSGTLFWTEQIIRNAPTKCRIFAVDLIYNENFNIDTVISKSAFLKKSDDKKLICENGEVYLYQSIDDVILDCDKIDCTFICDTIHHLNPVIWESMFNVLANKSKSIIIKDMDARRQFRNTLNRLHDRIINGEKIINVYPDKLSRELMKKDYIVSKIKPVYKLWYPHFIISAIKNECAFKI